MIWGTFLARIFFGKTKTLSPIVGTLSTMPVKMAGLGLMNPVTSVKEKYLSSQWGSAELIRAVTGGGAFSNADHIRTLGEERCDGQKNWEVANKTKLRGLFQDLKGADRRLNIWAKSTGAWISINGTTVSGTVLYDTESWDFLCTRYNFPPPKPPEPLRRMWKCLWGGTRTELQHRRPSHCELQQNL